MANRTRQNKQKAWKTAAYIRLSREDSDVNKGEKSASESVVNQRRIIDEFIKNQPDLGEYSTFIDDGQTGTNFDREGFQAMLEEIKKGNINCVVCKDLSRFGRNYTEAGMYMEQIFPMFGVRFIAINDHVDSYLRPSEMDSILIPIKNLLNDSYSRDLSVKVKSALTAMRKRGEFIGAFAPMGYRKDADDPHRLVIDEEVAPVIRNIFKWYVEGMGQFSIVQKLNGMGIPSPAKYRLMNYSPKRKHSKEYAANVSGLWSVGTLRKVLENPTYCGDMAQGKKAFVSYKNSTSVTIPKENWIIAEGTHEGIISKEIFEKAQELLKIRAKPAPKTGVVHLFSGLLYCADCNRAMTRTKNKMRNGEPYIYYRCSTRYRLSKTACTSHIISEKTLENVVLQTIKSQIHMMLDVDKVISDLDRAKQRHTRRDMLDKQKLDLKKKIESNEKLKMGLYSDLKKGILTEDEYITLKSVYTEEIAEFTNSLDTLGEEYVGLDYEESLQNSIISEFKEHKNIGFLTRELLTQLVQRIYIYEDKRIQIVFRYNDEIQRIIEMVGKEKLNIAS